MSKVDSILAKLDEKLDALDDLHGAAQRTGSGVHLANLAGVASELRSLIAELRSLRSARAETQGDSEDPGPKSKK